MVDERIVRLVLKLHENSKDGRISWQPTLNSEIFEVSFPKYSLQIGPQEHRNAVDYVITIFNDEGVAVDNFSDEDLKEKFELEAPETGWYRFMEEIYQMARRKALGADQAIDAILGELE